MPTQADRSLNHGVTGDGAFWLKLMMNGAVEDRIRSAKLALLVPIKGDDSYHTLIGVSHHFAHYENNTYCVLRIAYSVLRKAYGVWRNVSYLMLH